MDFENHAQLFQRLHDMKTFRCSYHKKVFLVKNLESSINTQLKLALRNIFELTNNFPNWFLFTNISKCVFSFRSLDSVWLRWSSAKNLSSEKSCNHVWANRRRGLSTIIKKPWKFRQWFAIAHLFSSIGVDRMLAFVFFIESINSPWWRWKRKFLIILW